MSKVSVSPSLTPSDLGDAVLERHALGLAARAGRPEAAADHAVAARQRIGPRQVELALGQPSRPRVLETCRVERRAVQLDEPAPHHRAERDLAAEATGERGLRVLDLVGQHVDQELVGRIRRQVRAPRVHEIAAHERQEQERHHAERERPDLQARGEAAARQVGESEAPRHATPRQALQQRHEEPCGERGDTEQRADADDHDHPSLGLARLPGNEERHGGHTERVGEHAARSRARQVAAQHPERRHVGERDERRHGEPEEQQQSGREGLETRLQRRCGKPSVHHRGEHADEQRLSAQRGGDADRARDHAEHQELQHEQAERLPHRRAEAAHHRRGVEMTAQVARRGERHGDRRQQDGDQRGEAEELLRAIERLPHLGAQVADGLHALAGLELLAEPGAEALEAAASGVGDEQAVVRPIAGLQQVGRGNIVEIQQQLRAQREHHAGDLGLLLDDCGDRKRRLADREFRATVDAHALREPRIDPDLAASGDRSGDAAVRIAGLDQPHRAAQRIAGTDRLDVGQDRRGGASCRVACRLGCRFGRPLHHAVEADHRRAGEAVRAGSLGEPGRQRSVTGDHQVAPEQQVRLPGERALDAVGEETDRADARHREDQRRDQHPQFARAPVAAEHAQREAQRVHGAAPGKVGSDSTFLGSRSARAATP